MGIRRRRNDAGATAVEYGILIALIAAVIIVAVAILGGLTGNAFDAPCAELATAGQPC